MAFIDLVNALKDVVDQRFTFKTVPLSIKKTDSSNTFKDVLDLLLQAHPTDENRTIIITQLQTHTINWQTDIVPGTINVTYSNFFGDRPTFVIGTNSSPEIINDVPGNGISRTFSTPLPDGLLMQVDFDFGPFLTDGIIIIN